MSPRVFTVYALQHPLRLEVVLAEADRNTVDTYAQLELRNSEYKMGSMAN